MGLCCLLANFARLLVNFAVLLVSSCCTHDFALFTREYVYS
ncbi:hypothetical protein [Peribacillus sp. ACCC06369]|nr:hypothetical protein [Peribacillus sp. ACCC06369]MDM5360205.1 hypothetical protein [Peribacillus sp. ACCC06369]